MRRLDGGARAGNDRSMQVLTTPQELDAWKSAHPGSAFVPTMGALHAGHAALVTQAAATGRPTIVSVFVNPTQFNEKADFDRYPKTLDADAAICHAAGAVAVWAPTVADIYPGGTAAGIVMLPKVAIEPRLEDAMRPGHFAGVCQVVKRLFELVRPAVAVFGEKDWQQLCVITAMVDDFRGAGGPWPEIQRGVTVRETDGLAMSSRNRFLTAEDRTRGLAISRALRAAVAMGTRAEPAGVEETMRRTLAEAGIEPEYAVVRDAVTLTAPKVGEPVRRLIAARVGAVRLIDNM